MQKVENHGIHASKMYWEIRKKQEERYERTWKGKKQVEILEIAR